MTNINKYTLVSLLSLSALFFSCDKDDATGDSTIDAVEGVTGVITVPSTTVIEVAEEDEETFNFSVTIDKPQVVDIHLRVQQISGSAHAGDDFEIPTEIVIPAYSTTASGTVKILSDCEAEGFEDFTIQIGDIATSNATIPSKTISFNIENVLKNDLDLTFAYNKNFTIAAVGYSLCQIGYDMDYYLLDADFNDTGIYDAATSACPAEHLTLTAGDIADGTYYIFYDIYDDGNLSNAYHDPFTIPTLVSYERCGGINPANFPQEEAFVPKSIDGSGSEYVITVKVNNGVFTLENSNESVIASGRNANKIKETIKAARAKARK